MIESKEKGLLKGLPKKEYFKKYFQDNREKFRESDERQAIKRVFCVACKSSFISKYLTKHENTKLHKKNVERYKVEIVTDPKNVSQKIEDTYNALDECIQNMA
jgi:hypothetical protein